MSAEQRLKEGDLAGALSALQNEVRDDPSNADKRRFLFQLLSVLGSWDRALTQLEVLADLDAKSLVIVAAYRAAIRAEKQRVDIYAGKQNPMIFGEPQRWVANMVEALRLEASGSVQQAQELRDEGLEEAPAIAGSINDVPFNWIADSDSRLGPILEAIVDGDLYWVPFDRIQKIEIEPPVDLRDLVWMPVQFTWANEGQAVGLIPTRYPGSDQVEDSQIRLSRKTTWVEICEGCHHGQGQRTFTTDADEYALLDTRKVLLDVPRADG